MQRMKRAGAAGRQKNHIHSSVSRGRLSLEIETSDSAVIRHRKHDNASGTTAPMPGVREYNTSKGEISAGDRVPRFKLPTPGRVLGSTPSQPNAGLKPGQTYSEAIMASKSAARRKGEAASSSTTQKGMNPWAEGLAPGILTFCRRVARERSLEILAALWASFPERIGARSKADIADWENLWFEAACHAFAFKGSDQVEDAFGFWLKHLHAVNEYHAQHQPSAPARANGAA